MFKKVIAQIETYTPKLTKAEFDSNEAKIQKEISEIEKNYPTYKQISVDVTFNGKKQTLDKFLKLLKQKLFDLKEIKDVKSAYDTPLFQNIGGKNVDVSTDDAQEELKREVAALEKQIQVREQTLAEIDNYVVTLLTGEMGQLNISHTNAKFVKIANDDMNKMADEEIEEYYNDLYEDTPGNPPYGTALEHYEENRNKLTEDIKKHSSSKPEPKFKKK